MKSKRASSGKHIRAKGGTKVKRSPTGLLLAAVGVIVVLLLVVYFTIASSYRGVSWVVPPSTASIAAARPPRK